LSNSRFSPWRILFVAAALLLLAGGPQHPGGSMAEMLAHPMWVPAHALVTAGFAAMLIGLVRFRRSSALPERSSRWLRLALIGTSLQVLEMVFHTAASVDHANLMAGRSTPILTTHLFLAVICYPIFGATLVGFILAAARDRVLGSHWISWVGILGAVAHGASAPLVVAGGFAWARILFPMVLFVAIWLLLAAFWPIRERAPALSAGTPSPAV
jgi:hypothetical protein